MCTGRATYGINAQMPGMVYASIERSPVLGGQLKAYDDRDIMGRLLSLVPP